MFVCQYHCLNAWKDFSEMTWYVSRESYTPLNTEDFDHITHAVDFV